MGHLVPIEIHPTVGEVTAGHHLHHLIPVEIHPTVGEVTARHYLHHLVPIEMSHATDTITVIHHCHIVLIMINCHAMDTMTVACYHLAPIDIMVNVMVAMVVKDKIVMSPLCGMVNTATQFQGCHCIGITSVSVSMKIHCSTTSMGSCP
jgi:hypothetical protein